MPPLHLPAPRVAIVGGGFSGALVAANLLARGGGRPVEVAIVEREARIGPGTAYGTWRIDHLLNVPARQMSAWEDRPGHFVEWVSAFSPIGPGDFAPRRMYGRYIEAVLGQAEAAAPHGSRLVRVRDEVVDVELAGDGSVRVLLAEGEPLVADAVVLAPGTPAPGLPEAIDPDALGTAYAHDPWGAGVLDELPRDGRVLLLGTGLTMADVAVSLADGTTVELTALSRRGLLPRRFAPAGPAPALELPAGVPTARSLVRAVRQAIAASPAGDWPAVFAALRPRTRELWDSLEPAEQRRLLARVGRQWDVHRHRMPPPVAARIDELQATGRLAVAAGEVVQATPRRGRIDVTIARPGRTLPEAMRVDAIVNCTGPASSPWAGGALVRTLLARGLVRADALDAGLDVTHESRLLDADGRASQLLALGWLCRGTRFESTAVPELRNDAAQVAREALRVAREALAAQPVI